VSDDVVPSTTKRETGVSHCGDTSMVMSENVHDAKCWLAGRRLWVVWVGVVKVEDEMVVFVIVTELTPFEGRGVSERERVQLV
jgi:hypothetical protein